MLSLFCEITINDFSISFVNQFPKSCHFTIFTISTHLLLKPREILEELRQQVVLSLSQFGRISEHKDGMDVSVCVIDTESMSLEFSGANNSAFLIRDSKLMILKANCQTVGINLKNKPFTSTQTQLKPGDALYLFTDGLSSQLSSNRYEKFKITRFKDLLVRISDKSLEKHKTEIVNELYNWQGSASQVDDILIVGIRI